ncbi:hypothetical protein F5X68DRAFT_177269 [Plectosphaerella plurivora]|uniref:Zn(2)-C6 fungal-type domain-containing protein n=1 Tax=Plectosphaerella plurivora TaxID=936078 RepID=A0A9P8V225_9PEZI|nr:hypothetical protein F5X68DRAFT_177269 [Plectosphaerella plurivora]
MKRFGHKKSRNGCVRCKQRRCDEKAPCSACSRHRVPCSLSPDAPPTAVRPMRRGKHSAGGDSASTSQSPETDISSVAWPDKVNSETLIPYSSKFHQGVQEDRAEDWAADLEMMHHYATIAHATFTNCDEVRQALQTDVVHMAMRFRFLLQQILAFAGFHLAYTRPDQRQSYALKASTHHDRAIAGMRAALGGSITQENCHALYAGSIFLIISTFATFPSFEVHNKDFSPVDGIVDVLKLIDGISCLLQTADGDLRSGPLEKLFAARYAQPGPMPERLQELSERLNAFMQQLRLWSHVSTSEELEVVREMTQAMIRVLDEVGHRPSPSASIELRAVFSWPIAVSNKHLDLIMQRHPAALVTLAYYLVIVSYAAESCWFLEGWAFSVGSSLKHILEGSVYEEAMEWPMGTIMAQP